MADRPPRLLTSSERAFLQVAVDGELHGTMVRLSANQDRNYAYLAANTVFRGRPVRRMGRVVLLRLLQDGILVPDGTGLLDVSPYGQQCAEKSGLRLEAPTLSVPDHTSPIPQ